MKNSLRRASHRLGGFALAFLILITVTGCTWYLTVADPAAELLIHEHFDENPTNTDEWKGGALYSSPNFQSRYGRLEIFGPWHYLLTMGQYPVDATAVLGWSVISGDVSLAPAAGPDFAILLEEGNVAVWLELYRDEEGILKDRLRVTDLSGVDVADPDVKVSTGITQGTLEVRFHPSGTGIEVEARVPELDLEVTTNAVFDGSRDSAYTIIVSGLPGNPRALEDFILFQEPEVWQ